jgi:hypothetical protein
MTRLRAASSCSVEPQARPGSTRRPKCAYVFLGRRTATQTSGLPYRRYSVLHDAEPPRLFESLGVTNRTPAPGCGSVLPLHCPALRFTPRATRPLRPFLELLNSHAQPSLDSTSLPMHFNVLLHIVLSDERTVDIGVDLPRGASQQLVRRIKDFGRQVIGALQAGGSHDSLLN